MATGRNDPCPCGSGKKYKKCCMKKDAEERAKHPTRAAEEPEFRQMTMPGAPPTEGPRRGAAREPAGSPEDETRDPFWREFERASYEDQVRLFQENVADREKMADGGAFEMLAVIHDGAMQRKEWDRFPSLIRTLRGSLPDVYEADAPRYLRRMIAAALAAGDLDALRSCARELGEKAGDDVDATYNAIYPLAYHGQLPALLDLMRPGWPKVQQAKDVMSWAVSEFAGLLRIYELFDYLDHAASPSASDPELLRRLGFEPDFDMSVVSPVVAALTRREFRAWTMGDFEVVEREDREDREDWGRRERGWELTDAGTDNLYELSNEFIGHLHRGGMPYTRADMGATELRAYIARRLAGELRSPESMLEAAMREQKHKPKPHHPLRLPENALCPDRATFDHFLADLLHFINPQHHKAAAAMEVVPPWLRFLEERGLLDAELRNSTLSEMSGLAATLANICETQSGDPLLGPALRAWS